MRDENIPTPPHPMKTRCVRSRSWTWCYGQAVTAEKEDMLTAYRIFKPPQQKQKTKTNEQKTCSRELQDGQVENWENVFAEMFNHLHHHPKKKKVKALLQLFSAVTCVYY